MSRVLKQVARWAGASLLLFCSSFYSSAQVLTTPNVIGTTVAPGPAGVQQSWTGFIQTPSTGGGYSGGNIPGYNVSTGQFMFGYSQGTIGYTMAINSALSGSGVQIGGMQYGVTYVNQGDAAGTLSITAGIRSNTGQTLQSYTHNLPATTNWWTQWSQSQTFANPYSLANLGDATLSFTGKDARFWAGYYGPQFKDPFLRFTYTVDPCVTNPAYSPSCPGFNTVVTSGNLLYGTTGPQAYAINQALAAAGSGAVIHGFDYGYTYNVAGRQCSFIDLFGLCITGWNYSDAGVSTVITDSAGSEIYSSNNVHNGGDNGKSGVHLKQLRFGSSLPMSSLGGFAMHPWTSGNASITNMHSNAVYTADPCISNPLVSPSCPGYAAAYFTQQCSSNPLYDSQCPGYAQAYFTQQCSANALYNQACPGYASAYLSYQCSLNPLYATQCPGYEQAYFTQQCSISGLYSTNCPNYATAYKAQQCSLNALYATDCPGYEQAYFNQQCSANALYNSACPGYAQAYFTQQCNLNGLYSRDCPNYGAAYAKKNLLEQQNTTTTTTTTTATSPTQVAQVSKTEATPSISSDGTVKAEVSKTGDSNVDKAISSPTTTTNTAAAPAAAVQLAPRQENKTEPTKAVAAAPAAKEEKKEQKQEPKSEGGGPQQTAKADSSEKDKPKTAREEIQQKREEAAKAKAVEEGKQMANKMGDVANYEQQIAVQNVVIQAMGYTPGFDSYNKARILDAPFYRPTTIYGGNTNVDNARLGRGLFGPGDRLHEQMIMEQYKK